MSHDPMVTLSEPVARYLLALVLDENMRSEAMDKFARPLLAEALFDDNGKFILNADAPQLATEAFRATIWKEAS
jgi:hypothetical protein